MSNLERGIAYGIDGLVAFLICCVMMHCMLLSLSSDVRAIESGNSNWELERVSQSLVDILVKNSDTNGFGCAYYNSELHRVEENVVDRGLLYGADFSRINSILGNRGFVLDSVYLEYLGGGSEKVFELGFVGECFAVERFVVVKGAFERKGKIIARVCDGKGNSP